MINILKKLGPGLLFAGAAIGVSHLVQSTRAGADFGFSLLWVLILSNIIKYPFFYLDQNMLWQLVKLFFMDIKK